MSETNKVILPAWDCPKQVIAYTSTRVGGVSLGEYAGCNVGDHVGDNPDAVALNRASLPEAERIFWLKQVHGNHVVTLPSRENQADAAYSNVKGHYCAVMTADCIPILICDQNGTQVASVHAGWKGLHLNIIQKTIALFTAHPSKLMAWIGPAICQRCYEVDRGLVELFSSYPSAIAAGKNQYKYWLDLPAIAYQQLVHENVGHIVESKLCTYCNHDMFYSHRYATHQGYSNTGRIVSVIGLR